MRAFAPILVSAFVSSLIPVNAVSVHSRQDDENGDTGTGNGITTIADLKNPQCAPFYAVRDAIMGGIFQGRCGDNTRAAIRLAFHDAAPFSLALQQAGLPNGGADGSMLTDPTEVQRPDNNGLQTIVGLLAPLPAQFGVSPGDVLHLAGTLAVVACPGGPVINTWVGRPEPINNPDGLLPNTHAPVSTLTARFADMGFSVREMMALIGSHSTGKQRFVQPSVAGSSFDASVEIWDVRFYGETQTNATIPGVFRLPSDVAFAHNSLTQQDYNRFVGASRQDNWAREYSKAHEKMSLLGQNQTALTDCTEVMPFSIDLSTISAAAKGGDNSNPVIDPVKLEAAIEEYRAIWI